MELREQVLRINETARKILKLAANPNYVEKLKRTEILLCDEERKSLFLAIDLCYNNMVTRLQQENTELSDDDLFYCCLLKMGISQEITCLLLSTNPTALKKRKYRIKNEKIEQAHSYNSLGFAFSLHKKNMTCLSSLYCKPLSRTTPPIQHGTSKRLF